MNHYFIPLDAGDKERASAASSDLNRRQAQAVGLRTLHQRNNRWAQRAAETRNELDEDKFDITTIMPSGGIISSAMNLASTTIGAGLLTVPAAFYRSGMGMAVFYLLIFGALTVYSYTLLAIAGLRTGYRSYHLIAKEVMGPVVGVFAAVCFMLNCFSILFSCIMAISQIVHLLFDDAGESLEYLQTDSGRRFLTSMVWLVCMLPLCMARKADGLKYFSLIAVVLVALFVVFVVIHYYQSDTHMITSKQDLAFAHSGNSAIFGLSSFIFAYTSQIMAYSVFEELYQPSHSRLTLSAIVCVLISLVLYLLIGVYGYLEFGSLLEGGSILKMYTPSENLMMAFGYFFVAFKLCVSYGLHMMGLREGLYFICDVDVEAIDGWKHVIIVSIWALGSLMCALFAPDAANILDAAGALSGGFIAYILPALMVMYTGAWTIESVGLWHYMGSYMMLVAGVIAIVFSTGSSIYREVLSS